MAEVRALTVSRRGVLGALLAAPAVIRTPGLLMPVKAVDLAFYSGGTIEPRRDDFVEFIRTCHSHPLEEWQGEIVKRIADAFGLGPDMLKIPKRRGTLAFAHYGKKPFVVHKVLWNTTLDSKRAGGSLPLPFPDSAVA